MQAMMLSAENVPELRPAKPDQKAGHSDISADKSDSPAAVKDGSSFLSIIQKMLAGAMEGTAENGGTIPGTEELSAEMNQKTVRQLKNKMAQPQKSPAAGTVMPDTGLVSSGEQKVRTPETALNSVAKKVKTPHETLSESRIEKNVLHSEFDGKDPAHEQMIPAAEQQIQQNLQSSGKKAVKRGVGSHETDDAVAEITAAATDRTAAQDLANMYTDQRMSDLLNPAKKSAVRKASGDSRIIVEDNRTTVEGQSMSSSGRVSAGVNTVDMALYLPTEKNAATGSVSSQKAGAKNFSQLLSQSINEAVPEIVHNGLIVLNDNNQGTIRLTLHPETLGNVKINLKISENQVTGQITVASEEAFDAFKDNIKVLETSFAENGFEMAGFDLGYSGRDRQQDTSSAQSGIIFGNTAVSSLSGRTFSDGEVAAVYNGAGSSLVNIVA